MKLWALAPLLLLAACSTGSPPAEVAQHGRAEYADADTLFPHLRYPDGQVSLNDRCMVRAVKLNPRMPAIYVNGRPVGFC